jgi:hypothetical protein
MKVEYSDKPVSAWGGMMEMKELLDRTQIRSFLSTLNLPRGRSNNKH